ncbi:MAG: hypothetical protein KDE03_07080 [Rhodobacteraceae bacterium]|nr:hypothetical protein [Paracoccaceae bacterium]
MIVSGIAHLGAILWLLLGGIFFSHDLPPPVATAEVTLMSEAEFSALQAAAPKAAEESPPEPALPEPVAAPEPTPPQPKPEPEPVPEPTPEPDPAPAPEPTPPAPVADNAAETIAPEPQPDPKAAPVVAPDPVSSGQDTPEQAPEAVAETAPEPDAAPAEPAEAAAPPETGEVLQTEANKDQTELASGAPLTSARPKSRPEKPAPKPEPDPAPKPEPEPVQTTEAEPVKEDAPDTAVNDAVAAAIAGDVAEQPAPGTGTASSGPPMTGGEKDALVIAVKQCWNVGALSTDALKTIVTIGVSMDPSGKPISSSIQLLGSEGGNDASVRQAFEAGRRAIIRCGQNGFPLPPEKYDQWQDVEIVFNPEKMRMK